MRRPTCPSVGEGLQRHTHSYRIEIYMKNSQQESTPRAYSPFGFQVSRKAWQWYQMAELAPGPDQVPDIYALRRLADRMNRKGDVQTYASEPVHAGQLMAVGLLTEVLRYLVDRYCVEDFPGSLADGLEATRAERGPVTVEESPPAFVKLYPPRAVLDGEQSEDEFIEGAAEGAPSRHVAAREMALLHLAMANPALGPFEELYDDADLRQLAPYEPLVDGLDAFFETQPPFDGSHLALFEFLRAPMRASPDSLEGQLEYIIKNWVHLLPRGLLERLLLAADIMKEESWLRGHGPGAIEVLHFDRKHLQDYGYSEVEAFTHDKDWMSNVVLIAKSVYVWLDQLSSKYGRSITRLDQIPDEELHRLARWGFTGLWLIGVWERSPASQKIKQQMGNPEALSSAYSIYDYAIAGDLGGEEAYENLKGRAWQHGIRLASDMVPNHVGIYSKWVIEHPGWFIQLEQPPFPGYQFSGPDLSWDSRVGLFIEDGYWRHGDAAVVFKRVDKLTGDVRYIYHGNDGTNMPWNDTAQLNYLLPEVREAVIQMIVHVARRFPIIRFDAAMTLAKKHYQRLWFPQPGDAGAIPSRAEHGMTKHEFDKLFPKEFWREVVDRIQREAPDTLLLAEAFWLMEGYFVRTLGMHRVYNSAFMNMLKMEENAKYRQTVKNVLEFTPEVLKRFVNFMNNPDERTAVDQFGKDDKYYGVAVLMVTMPGLPMFGHGQIEGFTERYGMEYRRAYWDEQVDEHMVSRHETEIFPLMRKRRLFSGAENFAFYDFQTSHGTVDENVFAYSNRAGDERALILYNNAYNTTSGTIHTSTPINLGDVGHKSLVRKNLAEALGLNLGERIYYVFRDHKTGIEYIRHARQLAEEGLQCTLEAYQYHALLDFREIEDTDGTWGQLAASLKGRGVPSVDEAYEETVLAPVLDAFQEVMNAKMLRDMAGRFDAKTRTLFEKAVAHLVASVALRGLTLDAQRAAQGAAQSAAAEVDLLRKLPRRIRKLRAGKELMRYFAGPIPAKPTETLSFWRVPLAFVIAWRLDEARRLSRGAEMVSKRDERPLAKPIARAFRQLGADEQSAWLDARLVRIMCNHFPVLDFYPGGGGRFSLHRMFEDPAVQEYLLVNRHQDVLWFNREQMEKLVYWLFFASVLSLEAGSRLDRQALTARFENATEILEAAETSEYQVEKLFQLLAEDR